MVNACTECLFQNHAAEETPCATCLDNLKPGERLDFRNFKRKEDGDE